MHYLVIIIEEEEEEKKILNGKGRIEYETAQGNCCSHRKEGKEKQTKRLSEREGEEENM